MPTTFVNTIDGNELLAKRSQCDYAGNVIQTTYATKNELPTATSDLTNDSDFITSSDIPVKDVQVGGTSVVNAQGIAEISIPQTGVLDVEVDGSSVVNAQGVAEISMPTFTQVNADWDASSGVQEILHKPDLSIYAESSDLATVATSGSYNDLLDKPSIPSAQVNADWDATSGVSEILHKPNLATVATTGDYSDLQNLPSIPAAQVNSDWDATSGVAAILNKPTLATVATTGAYSDLSGTPTIPSYTAGDGVDITNNIVSAKVDGTTIDTNASGELTVIGGGGGGSQVNSDWDATSGIAEILNKPDLSVYATTSAMNTALADKQDTLTAGSNISISNNVINATDTTYSAGTGIDITNNEISVETPVDIVAGPGIVVDNPDGNTLRVSTEADAETVLWDGTAASVDTAKSGLTLTESPFNFEYVEIHWVPWAYNDAGSYKQEAVVRVHLTSSFSRIGLINEWTDESNAAMFMFSVNGYFTSTKFYTTHVKWFQIGVWTVNNTGTGQYITKIVGVHRIANN